MAKFTQKFHKDGDELFCYNCHSTVPTALFKKHIINSFEDKELCKYCAGMFGFEKHAQMAQCFNILEKTLVDKNGSNE